MTIDERFERIEHVTAGLAEERRKDREEYRQLWRDTQKQFAEANAAITRLAEESRAADQRLEKRIEDSDKRMAKLAEESREADRRLGERIDSLVSAMGEWIAKQPR